MDTATLAMLKQDFSEWSGGFAPDSIEQITVYVDYALPTGIDRDDARGALVEWMNQVDAG